MEARIHGNRHERARFRADVVCDVPIDGAIGVRRRKVVHSPGGAGVVAVSVVCGCALTTARGLGLKITSFVIYAMKHVKCYVNEEWRVFMKAHMATLESIESIEVKLENNGVMIDSKFLRNVLFADDIGAYCILMHRNITRNTTYATRSI